VACPNAGFMQKLLAEERALFGANSHIPTQLKKVRRGARCGILALKIAWSRRVPERRCVHTPTYPGGASGTYLGIGMYLPKQPRSARADAGQSLAAVFLGALRAVMAAQTPCGTCVVANTPCAGGLCARVQAKPEPVTCPVCGAAVGISAASLQVHLKRVHPATPPAAVPAASSPPAASPPPAGPRPHTAALA
jgi:hypothetical protein